MCSISTGREECGAHDIDTKENDGDVGIWQAETNVGWQRYSAETSDMIAKAEAAGQSTCVLILHGYRYCLNFAGGWQINLSTGRQRRMRQWKKPPKPTGCSQCGDAPVESGELYCIHDGDRWLCGTCWNIYRSATCCKCNLSQAWSGTFGVGPKYARQWYCRDCWKTWQCQSAAEFEAKKNDHQGDELTLFCSKCGGVLDSNKHLYLRMCNEGGVHVSCAKRLKNSEGNFAEKLQLTKDEVQPIKDLLCFCRGSSKSLEMVRDFETLPFWFDILTEFPAVGLKLRGLLDIRLQCQSLVELPDEIAFLGNLQGFTVSGCPLSCIPESLGTLVWLRRLSITGTCIAKIPLAVAHLPRLTNVLLDANVLTELPCFTSSDLYTMNAAGNRLQTVTGQCCSKMLKVMRLNGNNLGQLPQLPEWSSLEEFKVAGNQLTALPDGLRGLQNLRWIYIADNRIVELPLELLELQFLDTLIAYNNCFTAIPLGLSRMPSMSILLLERNPLNEVSLYDLLSMPLSLRILGLDEQQVRRWAASGRIVYSADGSTALPQCVCSGRCVGGPDLPMYMKLVHTSQLQRQEGVLACGQEAEVEEVPLQTGTQTRVLVVAFTASKATGPEWLRLLRQVPGGDHGLRAGKLYPPTNPLPSTDGSGSQLSYSLLWRVSEEGENASCQCDTIPDFDVLMISDTRLRWYDGDENAALEAELRQLSRNYDKCVFIGSSMGGFGALLHAPIADVVLAFSPQVSVKEGRLRPGACNIEELEAHTTKLQEAVRVAQLQACPTRIEVHCSMDEYLYHALQLPLSSAGLTVHPLSPKRPFASVLNDADLLWPIVTHAISELLQPNTVPHTAVAPVLHSGYDPSRELRVAGWGGITLRTYWCTLGDVYSLCESGAVYPPKCGDWFCPQGHRNESSDARCCSCHSASKGDFWVFDTTSVIVPGSSRLERGEWGCGRCGHREPAYREFCRQCMEHRSCCGTKIFGSTQ